MQEKKVLKDLIKSRNGYLNHSDQIYLYQDKMSISDGAFKISGEKMFKRKLEGFFTFEDLLSLYPDMYIYEAVSTISDSSSVFVMVLSAEVRAVGILGANAYEEEEIKGKELTFIINNALAQPLDTVGVMDLTIAYPIRLLDQAAYDIQKLLEKKKVKAISTKADTYKLGLVTYTNNRIDITVRSIPFTSEYEDLDMLYSSIDQEYHETLMGKLHSTTKGNIVFNGPPGTGKSFYIRKLIKDYYITQEAAVQDKLLGDMSDEEIEDHIVRRSYRHSPDTQVAKLFIYIPSNLGHLFSDPTFTSVLQDKALEHKKGIVIILEDAEKLIENRDTDGSGTGVSALLNMSDGILNDIISTQFIFTYNTDTENVDSAILRPGRLLSKKTFDKLSVEKSNILAKELGVEKVYTEEMSIAEIFSETHVEENKILIEQDESAHKIGFRS